MGQPEGSKAGAHIEPAAGELEGKSLKRFEDRNRSPLRSPITKQAAAMFALGFEPLSKKSVCDATEVIDGKPQRVVSWAFNNKATATFRPIKTIESMSLTEAADRVLDLEWCEANPEHPLAHMGALIYQLGELEEKFRGDHEEPIGRHVVLNVSGKRCFLPAEWSEEQQNEQLREWKLI